jgi:hypothetical protein
MHHVGSEMRTLKIHASSQFTRTQIRSVTRSESSRLKRAASEEQLDADAARFYGPAALVAGAFDLGNDFLAAAVDGLRMQGRLGQLPRLLILYASMAARLGDWDVAITTGEEAGRLAEELGEPQWVAAADTAISLVAAMRATSARPRSWRPGPRWLPSRPGRTSRWRSRSSARCWPGSPRLATRMRTGTRSVSSIPPTRPTTR